MCQKIILLGVILITSGVMSSCGPRAFTKGEYDDPTRVELLDDRFNEADMQQMAEKTIKDLVECRWVRNAKKPPFVIVTRVKNVTEEHIDTVSMTDKVRTNLIHTGKVRFIAKEERETLEEEYKYNEGGNVSEVTAKRRGKQIGADYILSGRLSTNIQQVGSKKFIYYKLNMNLTNLETSSIDCASEKEVRKKFKKRRI